MTGFGTAEGPLAGGRLAIEVRSVNHRHFNPQFRLPTALQPMEPALRNRLRGKIARGNVAVQARWSVEPSAVAAVRVDVARARAVMAALNQLKRELELPGEVDLAFVARQPDVLTTSDEGELEVEPVELFAILDAALEQVVSSRDREGRSLAADVEGRLAALETSLGAVKQRAPARLEAEHQRLRDAMHELLEGAQLDEQRMAQEIALYADRVDISEEMVRLATHLDAARAALGQSEAVGRRLAFLGQEMLREINTIGSKANDAEITGHVLDMKTEVEKFREQVENIE